MKNLIFRAYGNTLDWQICEGLLSVTGGPSKCTYSVEINYPKMSNSPAQFVSVNFANFLLDNATNGDEILAVLDDLYEVQSTPL